MREKTISVEIPEEILKEAKAKNIDVNELREFAKKSIELDMLFLFSRMTKSKALVLSKKLGREAWKRL
ncbi:MAG: hypothetical protein J7K68_04390 [Candidatus Diapherotrites archaeon]|nr:hypothetical protein [Candidatus Diapherotrites archaeon]